jgi:glycosyltransferase involved in cell wall biosynthesis
MVKVSVFVITYNHGKFIRKALESIMSQKTNFTFEVLIGDDASTDETPEIIREFHEKYPAIIRPFLHQKNLGQNGLLNTIETIQHVKGEYIASLDGDDYWTDDYKLQKQADYLDKNPTFSACFHNAQIIYSGSDKVEILNPENQKNILDVEDFIGEEEIWFMATSSVLFRNWIDHYPDWFLKSISGDIPRYIMLIKKGKIGYLPDLMSIYRKHLEGASFSDKYDSISFLQNRIDMYKGIDKELGYKYTQTLRKNMARYYKMMLFSGELKKAYFHKLKIIFTIFGLKKVTFSELKEIIRDTMLPPFLVKVYSFFALLPQKLK